MPDDPARVLPHPSWLRVQRERAGLTQKQVAHALGISASLWKKIERGVAVGSVRNTRRLTPDLRAAFIAYIEPRLAEQDRLDQRESTLRRAS